MTILLLIVIIISAILMGVADWLESEYDRRRDLIDYIPYNNSNERTEARKKLKESMFYKTHIFFNKMKDSFCWITAVSALGCGACLILMFFIWSPQIDEKIALYEEENTKIETQIAAVVNQYQQFELNVITECTPESAMTLVSLYPDLKSDVLVTKQVETYIKNNDKIKELKEEKINQKLIGWWFNFNAW